METPLADSDNPVEQKMRRIWEAIEKIVRKSQRTVQHTGQAIRVEAVRSEKGQTLYRPLQAYIDADGVAKHIQPWQQIVVFIAHTQTARGGEQKRKRPRQLWQMAQVESAGPTRAGSPDPIDKDRKRKDREDSIQQWQISELEQIYLGFCIELLNQTYHAQKYKSALICAMAVLSRGEFGWCDPESYPPILSRVIKVARFIIIQQTLWLDPNAALRSAIPDIDSVYGSDSGDDEKPESIELELESESGSISPSISPIHSQNPPSRIHYLIIRGTYTPIETLQNWWIYRLKIHYNTTVPGHITWMQPDRLLYKYIQFTIGDFCGFVHGMTAATRQILRRCRIELFAGLPDPMAGK
ncbi:hypothetical protein BDV40DRAFT_294120 [Aspergillus tamarii]|uniref:Uncharacterized protein n=1 Tax=Aspergillus tamarii TaxID=41984 RepID=A0A5N6UBS1_ASPTM|nr:hypothetical protein BDV40DRAFT_294120 [Aspergillus tamarii]